MVATTELQHESEQLRRFLRSLRTRIRRRFFWNVLLWCLYYLLFLYAIVLLGIFVVAEVYPSFPLAHARTVWGCSAAVAVLVSTVLSLVVSFYRFRKLQLAAVIGDAKLGTKDALSTCWQLIQQGDQALENDGCSERRQGASFAPLLLRQAVGLLQGCGLGAALQKVRLGIGWVAVFPLTTILWLLLCWQVPEARLGTGGALMLAQQHVPSGEESVVPGLSEVKRSRPSHSVAGASKSQGRARDLSNRTSARGARSAYGNQSVPDLYGKPQRTPCRRVPRPVAPLLAEGRWKKIKAFLAREAQEGKSPLWFKQLNRISFRQLSEQTIPRLLLPVEETKVVWEYLENLYRLQAPR
jgi:uncharacterized membrane protein YhaH (DUF805 family)